MIQLQFLNKCLQEHDLSAITLNNLTVEYFSDYKDEFKYILNHYNNYGVCPDIETFLNVFPNFEIIQVNEPYSFLLEELFKDRNKTFLANNFTDIRKLLMQDKIDEAMQVLRQASELSSQAISLQCVDILHNTSRYDKYLDRLENKDKYFISTGLKELDDIIGGWNTQDDLVTIVARNGLGKCLEKGTKILMADGTLKRVEDVKVNDKVQSLDRVNTVLGLHNGKAKGYKIIPNLGDPFVISENHILTLMKRNQILQKGDILHTTDNTFTLVDMMIEDYLKLSKNQKRQYELYRPGVSYSTKEQKIPPYILGLWLGDGTSCRVSLTNVDPEIIEAWCNWGYQYTSVIRCDRKTYDITNPENKGGRKAETLELFRYYNLLNNKHIPLEYLTGDEKQRLDLLAGILDTDGYLAKKYRQKSNTTISYFSLCLKSKTLTEQVAQLARGLNFRVGSIKTRVLNNPVKGLTNYYTISIFGDVSRIPTRVARKKAIKSSSNRSLNLCGFKVEEVPEIEYFGFMCDGDSRYLLADNTLTHNTWLALKFAAAAAVQGKRVGLYSGEMSEDKVGYRIDSLIGHISNGALVHGGISVKDGYGEFMQKLAQESQGNLFVLTPKMINGSAGVSALRAFVEKYRLDILFIDQHSLLEDDRKATNPVEKAANISKDLKLLQVIKQIPIISVSQQNREKLETNGKVIFDTSQVAQSDRIAQDSTCIIFIERDREKKDLMKLHLVKSRDTEAGKVLTYRVDLNNGIFAYIPEGEESTTAPMYDSGAGETSYSVDDIYD